MTLKECLSRFVVLKENPYKVENIKYGVLLERIPKFLNKFKFSKEEHFSYFNKLDIYITASDNDFYENTFIADVVRREDNVRLVRFSFNPTQKVLGILNALNSIYAHILVQSYIYLFGIDLLFYNRYELGYKEDCEKIKELNVLK